ncbi:LLM class flavin-dependent oxidoreductase [Nocardioides sp.]|uniref:LLM class flavin-dependent oxidoreductase n=1 Tax=Nocardioides sp. TaxID=35761 RepID=UPI003510FC4D
MRVGLTILTDLPWREARPRWRAAEEMGFDHAWTYDHLVWGGLPEAPWTTPTPVLGAVADLTERIGLGLMVATPNFRHPYQLHRDAQALEDLADGRFLLGVGAGGSRDATILGAPALPPREHAERFFEFAEALVRFREEDHVTLSGRWFRTDDARTLPPLRRTPLILAANGPRSIRFAVATGDAWVTTGPWGTDTDTWWGALTESAALVDGLLRERAAAGPAGADFRRYLLLDTAPGPDSPGRTALASVETAEEMIARAEALGFTDVVLHWPRPTEPYRASEQVLERFAAEVLPRLQDPVQG